MKKKIILILYLFLIIIFFKMYFYNIKPQNHQKINVSKYQIIDSCQLKSANGNLYIVYTPDVNFNNMQIFAKNKSENSYNNIWVFFFNKRVKIKNLKNNCEDFNNVYEKYWVVGYWKYASGLVHFIKYPSK